MNLLFALNALERWWDPPDTFVSYVSNHEIQRNLPYSPIYFDEAYDSIFGEQEFDRILRTSDIPYYRGVSYWGDRLHRLLAEAFDDGWRQAMGEELVERARQLLGPDVER